MRDFAMHMPSTIGTVNGANQEDCVSGAGGAMDNSVGITLATRGTNANAVTQSTSGVYNVPVGLDLTVPAFLAADTDYTATMTITLVG